MCNKIDVLEHLFKCAVFKYVDCSSYADSWIEQIHNMHLFWNVLMDNIDKNKIIEKFKEYCFFYGLQPSKIRIKDAFKLSKTKWSVHIMFLVSNNIARQHIFGASSIFPIVKWSGHMMLVDWGSLHILL